MDCFYCERGQKLNDLMMPVCNLKVSTVYLVRNQNFPGRCAVVYQDHKTELFQLTPEQRHDFTDDVAVVSQAVCELFHADKINYGIFGDGVPHLHCHVVPKRKGEFCWGGMFDMNGNPDNFDDTELRARAELIRKQIEKLSSK
ncbi:HIT family protein [Caproiciproducens sp. NJN-50]|uniref:HIT family protein n=1 Tax=Acutalibacteraceae TaxID=3082771 RepID=UPI000FFE08D4|nr:MULTISPECIES: HIT family protein [Acutalibacteraceae]QAT49133.1 HIT family protein [Caproiciproducens sp. NJN-50]